MSWEGTNALEDTRDDTHAKSTTLKSRKSVIATKPSRSDDEAISESGKEDSSEDEYISDDNKPKPKVRLVCTST